MDKKRLLQIKRQQRLLNRELNVAACSVQKHTIEEIEKQERFMREHEERLRQEAILAEREFAQEIGRKHGHPSGPGHVRPGYDGARSRMTGNITPADVVTDHRNSKSINEANRLNEFPSSYYYPPSGPIHSHIDYQNNWPPHHPSFRQHNQNLPASHHHQQLPYHNQYDYPQRTYRPEHNPYTNPSPYPEQPPMIPASQQQYHPTWNYMSPSEPPLQPVSLISHPPPADENQKENLETSSSRMPSEQKLFKRFCDVHRDKLIASEPGVSRRTIYRRLSARWAALSKSEKSNFAEKNI